MKRQVQVWQLPGDILKHFEKLLMNVHIYQGMF